MSKLYLAKSNNRLRLWLGCAVRGPRHHTDANPRAIPFTTSQAGFSPIF